MSKKNQKTETTAASKALPSSTGSNMGINAEFLAGTSIKVAAEESIAMANRLQCRVMFDFNGVSCNAGVGGSPEEMVKQFHAALSADFGKLKMAFSH